MCICKYSLVYNVIKQKNFFFNRHHPKAESALSQGWRYIILVLNISYLRSDWNFAHFSTKRNFVFIYAILTRSVLYIYVFKSTKKTITIPFLQSFPEQPILKFQRIAPKVPSKFSCILPDSLVRTSGNSPTIPPNFRIDRTETLLCSPTLQTIHLFSSCINIQECTRCTAFPFSEIGME